jgi:hypothetical protein
VGQLYAELLFGADHDGKRRRFVNRLFDIRLNQVARPASSPANRSIHVHPGRRASVAVRERTHHPACYGRRRDDAKSTRSDWSTCVAPSRAWFTALRRSSPGLAFHSLIHTFSPSSSRRFGPQPVRRRSSPTDLSLGRQQPRPRLAAIHQPPPFKLGFTQPTSRSSVPTCAPSIPPTPDLYPGDQVTASVTSGASQARKIALK